MKHTHTTGYPELACLDKDIGFYTAVGLIKKKIILQCVYVFNASFHCMCTSGRIHFASGGVAMGLRGSADPQC